MARRSGLKQCTGSRGPGRGRMPQRWGGGAADMGTPRGERKPMPLELRAEGDGSHKARCQGRLTEAWTPSACSPQCAPTSPAAVSPLGPLCRPRSVLPCA